MADNDEERFTAVVAMAAAWAAGGAARKVLNFAWTRATGKEPPSDPQSPESRFGEALGWAVAAGVIFAWTRATGKEPPSDPQSPEPRFGEALGWAVAAGVCIEAARGLAVRSIRKRMARSRSAELGPGTEAL